MNKLIQKLKNRQNTTSNAFTELLKLIREIESNIEKDITTSSTFYRVDIKAVGWKNSFGESRSVDREFSLFVEDGYIKIKDIFGKDHTFHYFFDSGEKSRKIVRIDFDKFVVSLEELIAHVISESEKIDNNAQKFINFCENWKTQDK